MVGKRSMASMLLQLPHQLGTGTFSLSRKLLNAIQFYFEKWVTNVVFNTLLSFQGHQRYSHNKSIRANNTSKITYPRKQNIYGRKIYAGLRASQLQKLEKSFTKFESFLEQALNFITYSTLKFIQEEHTECLLKTFPLMDFFIDL